MHCLIYPSIATVTCMYVLLHDNTVKGVVPNLSEVCFEHYYFDYKMYTTKCTPQTQNKLS